ncbi:unnamed protein product [Ectocarpus sp. CCAP 1310/34]|nr:unnamed protein product [Ectocarpus sp. CCAP 1310/34]
MGDSLSSWDARVVSKASGELSMRTAESIQLVNSFVLLTGWLAIEASRASALVDDGGDSCLGFGEGSPWCGGWFSLRSPFTLSRRALPVLVLLSRELIVLLCDGRQRGTR